MAWLAAFPAGKPSRAAVVTNAGYESVVSADLLVGPIAGHVLDPGEVEQCKAIQLPIQLHGGTAPSLRSRCVPPGQSRIGGLALACEARGQLPDGQVLGGG